MLMRTVFTSSLFASDLEMFKRIKNLSKCNLSTFNFMLFKSMFFQIVMHQHLFRSLH